MKLKKAPPQTEAYNAFIFDDPKSYAAQCRRKTDNVLRGRVEAAFADNLIFITLTYDNKHLPQTYSQLKDLQIFRQRITRKKFPTLARKLPVLDENGKQKIYKDGTPIYKNKFGKWKERESAPLKLDKNKYRCKEILTEQDFKNAKHRFKVYQHANGDYREGQFGLLKPSHLHDFLECLRNDMRIKYNNPDLRLRFIANAEYGENSNRPHYHILIFNHHKDYDFYKFVRTYWSYGRIIDVRVLNKKDISSIKKVTAYIVGHTVKKDFGNVYQNEMSPCFAISSTYGGGIGYQLTDNKLMSTLNGKSLEDKFLRSLNFSLSSWNLKDLCVYEVLDDKGNKYNYPIPRYYRKKLRKYLNVDIRTYYKAQCNCLRSLITNFCKINNLHGRFDLLPLYHNIGLLKTPCDILEFFAYFNKDLLGNLCNNYANLHTFVMSYLNTLKSDDLRRRETFKLKYRRRKQQQKYEQALQKKGLINLS